MSAAGTPFFRTSVRHAGDHAMMLAGERVQTRAVEQLAGRLHHTEPLAIKLQRAVADEHAMVALTRDDRARLLEVLDAPPAGLGALRSRLRVQVERHRG